MAQVDPGRKRPIATEDVVVTVAGVQRKVIAGTVVPLDLVAEYEKATKATKPKPGSPKKKKT